MGRLAYMAALVAVLLVAVRAQKDDGAAAGAEGAAGPSIHWWVQATSADGAFDRRAFLKKVAAELNLTGTGATLSYRCFIPRREAERFQRPVCNLTLSHLDATIGFGLVLQYPVDSKNATQLPPIDDQWKRLDAACKEDGDFQASSGCLAAEPYDSNVGTLAPVVEHIVAVDTTVVIVVEAVCVVGSVLVAWWVRRSDHYLYEPMSPY